MRHERMLAAALVTGLALPLAAARAGAQEVCEPGAYRGPVALMVLASANKVHEYAATVRDARPLLRDAKTVIFDDGRVVTADVTSASEHLNTLGWAGNRIEFVATFRKRKPTPGRRRAVG